MENSTVDIAKCYPFEEIRSVSQYMRHIEDATRQLKSDMVRDEYLAFRGQSNIAYELIPSLARPLKYRADVQMLHFEKELIYTAQHEYPKEFLNIDSPTELLIKLQHYGIPTRLLDITTNALVALYFACCSSPNADGEVFVFKLRRDYHWNDSLTEFIADTYRLDLAEASIMDCAEIYSKQTYYVKKPNVQDEFDIYYEFRNDMDYNHKNPIVVQPPKTFERLNMQSGQFLLFTNDLCYDANGIPVEIDSSIHPIAKSHPFIRSAVRIPHDTKDDILRELAILGITRSALFHDNIDVVCEEIVKTIHQRTKQGK